MYLVIVDTAQIQPYIFGSNRLRENIGASYLVAQATGNWAKEAIRQVAPRNNIKVDGELDTQRCIENPTDKLDAEVFYTGGGNFVALFQTPEGARNFTRVLSRKVLTEAPNLQLVITQELLNWNGSESLSEKIKAAFKKLAAEKRARTLSAPLLGLGVTVMCRSTGLPAVGMAPAIGDDPERPASAEIFARLRAVEQADQRLRTLLLPPANYDYPNRADHLGGTKGEHNFIAVVHADGNGLGQRIMDIGKTYPNPSQNRDYINALRSFSEAVNRAATAALCETLEKLSARIQDDKGKKVIIHKNASGQELVKIELKSQGGNWLLPFRPLVFGGDDVTFVSEGRLGLSLAIEYLQQLEKHTTHLPDGKGRLTACAGIAIVKAHYPFARAYALADELCKKAKKYRKEIRNLHHDWDDGCLDWHFALSGLSGGIEVIREREYKVNAGWLTLRPVTLNANPKESGRSWSVVRKGIEAFQDLPPSTQPGQEPKWSTRRNKLKALRDALREGPDSIKNFLTKFNEGRPLPDVDPSLVDWKNAGWQGGYCGHFDALELADWFIPL
ncbi:MAG TPA: hypothetical protein VNM22_09315 [Candidatus Limnocylindrales bacterium]|nr:hypothetical protein [Candidatus Limnocylindrales bacterium]